MDDILTEIQLQLDVLKRWSILYKRNETDEWEFQTKIVHIIAKLSEFAQEFATFKYEDEVK